jgi:serine/threonine protein kinase
MRFFDWYETRNNLWLILEYCSGSDLQTLLNQDAYLPESSVRLFGLDLLAALVYLHSNGLIHCDIRPKNILIDEFGILKLSDFKFAKKIPKVADESTLGLFPGSCTSGHSKGSNKSNGKDSAVNSDSSTIIPVQSLPFQAPELLSSSCVVSIASDLYNLGCLLFLLKTGCMPYGDLTANCMNITSNATSHNGSDDDSNGVVDSHISAIRQGSTELLARIAAATEAPTTHPYPSNITAVTPVTSNPSKNKATSTNGTGASATPAVGRLDLSPELSDLLDWLLEVNPSQRPSW